MRLGKIKKIIDLCLNESNQLIVDHQAMYQNQAYQINNYSELIDVFDILSEQEWNDTDFGPIQIIIDEIGNNIGAVELDATQFGQLNSYISALNTKIPLYYSILKTMVEDQDEKIINIKIPDAKITSLKDLSEFNSSLEKTLKQFNIDGQFEFVGFDKGSSRYEIVAVGIMTYRVLIGGLKIANEILDIKKTYYEGKNAELDYKASLKKKDDFDKKDLEKYKQKRIELEIEERVEDTIEKMGIKGSKSKIETQNQIIKATTSLIKELEEGTEFHLSLNPPSYTNEVGGSLEINYTQISALIEKENQPKKLVDKFEGDLEDNDV